MNPSTESVLPVKALLTKFAREYLSGRRGLIILGVAVLSVSAALNWDWLTAIGIAPVLLALAPCAVMCALGLCMNRAGGSSCATSASTRNTSAMAADDAMPMARTATLDASHVSPTEEVRGAGGTASSMNPERQSPEERSKTNV